MALLNRLFGGKSARFSAPIQPEEAFFAVGDIHGCHGKLLQMLEKLASADANAKVVFVGDYCDRGDQSADVIRHLMKVSATSDVTCLIGNHEEMMLNFLAAPEKKGARWLRYGGLQTLASFGVSGVSNSSKGEELVAIADALRNEMGPEMISWLEGLQAHWQSGNVAVVHAGADPELPISEQSDKTLRWGHPDFDKVARTDETWVVHGHTIVDNATATNGRIAVDTGAYATGRLTAAHITNGNVDFLQV